LGAVVVAAGCGGAAIVRVDAQPVTSRPVHPVSMEPARAVFVDAAGARDTRLVRLDLATGRRRVLLRSSSVRGGEVGLRAPALSPDGRSVAVVSAVGGPDYRTVSTILVVPVAGGRARRVPGVRLVDAGQLAPVWTPDGHALALPHDAEHDNMDLVDVRTGRRRALLRGSAWGPVAFAPDGKTYAFSGPGGLWVRRAGRERAHRVARDARAPAWSPDGRHLAYLSTRDRHGRVSLGDAGSGDAAELYVADAGGSHARRLTETTADELAPPRWTTDSTAIALLRFDAGVVTARAIGVARRCDAPLAKPAGDAFSSDPTAWDLRAPLVAIARHGCR
jgi:Tol biopolymer transport system component